MSKFRIGAFITELIYFSKRVRTDLVYRCKSHSGSFSDVGKSKVRKTRLSGGPSGDRCSQAVNPATPPRSDDRKFDGLVEFHLVPLKHTSSSSRVVSTAPPEDESGGATNSVPRPSSVTMARAGILST